MKLTDLTVRQPCRGVSIVGAGSRRRISVRPRRRGRRALLSMVAGLPKHRADTEEDRARLAEAGSLCAEASQRR